MERALLDIQTEQNRYIANIGGYLGLMEADDYFNDLNRQAIQAFKREHGTAFLGNINFYDDERQEVIDGADIIFEEYSGQVISNFSHAFCVAQRDRRLEQLIRGWNAKADTELLNAIFTRIEKLGGLLLVWT